MNPTTIMLFSVATVVPVFNIIMHYFRYQFENQLLRGKKENYQKILKRYVSSLNFKPFQTVLRFDCTEIVHEVISKHF